MNTVNQRTMNNRLSKLETQSRTLRVSQILNFTLIITLISISGFQYFGLDFTKGKVVSAEKFVLKDRQGNIRAELKSDDYATYFALFDTKGIHRASMAIADGDPGFHLYDEAGFRQAVIGISKEGPNLVFMKPTGLLHAGISLLQDGNLGFFNGQGNNTWQPIPLHSLSRGKMELHEINFKMMHPDQESH